MAHQMNLAVLTWTHRDEAGNTKPSWICKQVLVFSLSVYFFETPNSGSSVSLTLSPALGCLIRLLDCLLSLNIRTFSLSYCVLFNPVCCLLKV